MDNKTRNIGIDVKAPEKECNDRHCPFHGEIKLHGRIFKGTVLSSKAQKTVTVRIKRLTYITKYERYGKKETRIYAHNPECIDAKKGDLVKIMETRPISKIKNFVVVEKIGHEIEEDIKAVEAEEEAEKAKPKKEAKKEMPEEQ